MDEYFIPSDLKPPGRRVWSDWPDGDMPSVLLVFLDAELYLERVSAPQVVRRLAEQRRIPPVASVYVSNNGGAARHSDFVCDDSYVRVLVTEVLPFVWEKRRTMPDRVILLGLSLSGLAAAYAALTTRHFHAAVCQSPSFWWNEERLASCLPVVDTRAAAFWISVGDRETESDVSHPPSGLIQKTSQRDSCGRGVEALRRAGYAVSHRVFQGGHDPACWQEDLAHALPWATMA